MSELHDPFDVLGVTPDVDDAGLKRAYFAKVREHPPEKDPEGFQRVRAAFEALRDAEHRERLAEQRGGGGVPEALELLLTQAEKAQEADDPHTAIERLREAIDRFPDFAGARVGLARLLGSIQRTKEALTVAEQLARLRPSDAGPLVLLAELHAATYEYEPARAALAEAMRLAPNARRPLIAQASMLAQMEQWDAALASLDRALALRDRTVSDGEVLGRKVLLQMQRGVPEALEAEVQRVVERAETPEEKAGAASLLSSLAALAFRKDEPAQAHAILRRLAALRPSQPKLALDVTAAAPIARLSASAREEIERGRAQPRESMLLFPRELPQGPALLYVVSVTAFVLAVVLLGTVGPIGTAIFTAAGVLAWLGARAWRQALKEGRGLPPLDFVELRPLYLVHVEGQQAQALPLLALRRIHDQPGAGAALHFADGQVVRLATEVALAGVLRAAAQQRERLISLLAADLLETEQTVDPVEWAPA